MNINLRENLYRMRENYSRKPIRFKYLPQPSWLRTNDGLYQIYRDKKILLKHGKIYYAVMLQANVLLFNPKSRENCPANFIYTTDLIGEENPEILTETAPEISDSVLILPQKYWTEEFRTWKNGI